MRRSVGWRSVRAGELSPFFTAPLRAGKAQIPLLAQVQNGMRAGSNSAATAGFGSNSSAVEMSTFSSPVTRGGDPTARRMVALAWIAHHHGCRRPLLSP
jgi:hypothetical protein